MQAAAREGAIKQLQGVIKSMQTCSNTSSQAVEDYAAEEATAHTNNIEYYERLNGELNDIVDSLKTQLASKVTELLNWEKEYAGNEKLRNETLKSNVGRCAVKPNPADESTTG